MSPDARAALRRLVKLSKHILCTTQPETLLLSWRRASSTNMISSAPSYPPVHCPPSAGSAASAGRPVTAPRPVMRKTLQARGSVQALPVRPLVIRHRNALLQQAPQFSTEGTDDVVLCDGFRLGSSSSVHQQHALFTTHHSKADLTATHSVWTCPSMWFCAWMACRG